MKLRYIFIMLMLLVATACLWWVVWHGQVMIDYGKAPAFDGNQYGAMTRYFMGDGPWSVAFPFNGRVLVPWLVAQVPSSTGAVGNSVNGLVMGYQWVNLGFGLLAMALLYVLWQSMGIQDWRLWLGMAWLLGHWTGLVRHNVLDPVNVDLPLYAFQALLVLLVWRRAWWHLLWLTPLAVLQKESFLPLVGLMLPVGFMVAKVKGQWPWPWHVAALALALGLLAKWWVGAAFPPIEQGRGSLVTIGFHLKETVENPWRAVRWLGAAVMAYGLWWLPAGRYAWRVAWEPRLLLLAAWSLVYVGFGLLAGGDSTRIIFLGFPFIMTWVLLALQGQPVKWVVALALGSLPLLRLGQAIPNASHDWAAYALWFPEFAPLPYALAYLGYGVMLCVLLGIWRKRMKAS